MMALARSQRDPDRLSWTILSTKCRKALGGKLGLFSSWDRSAKPRVHHFHAHNLNYFAVISVTGIKVAAQVQGCRQALLAASYRERSLGARVAAVPSLRRWSKGHVLAHSAPGPMTLDAHS